MQDIEFTIQEGKLWMLQTRSGKRTTKAALKIAVDLVAEKVITPEEAVARIEPAALDQLVASDDRSQGAQGRADERSAGVARGGVGPHRTR